ncbi:MAG: PAS domain S-box protein [Deltaproteobacteria bacterium]|nr:PAS domain S-box protein [Deltaproteobacteria bacterium]
MVKIQSDGHKSPVISNEEVPGQIKMEAKEELIILRGLIDAINDHIYFKDKDGNYLACNQAFADYIGLDKEQIIGKTDFDIFPPEKAEFNHSNESAVINYAYPQYIASWNSKPDGKRLLIETCISPYLQTDGKLCGIVGVSRDISERKSIEERMQQLNAELQQQVAERTDELLQVNRELLSEISERKKTDEALRISEQRFRRIFETANEGIWVTDNDYRTILVNKKMAEMLGYTVAEMINKKPQSFMFEEDAPEYEERIALRRQGISEDLERRYRHTDGHAVWFKISASPLMDRLRTFQGSVAMLTDITERKRIERTLRDSEAKFRSLAESSASAIFIIQNRNIFYSNPAFEMITGYSMDDLSGIDFWDIIHPESRTMNKDNGLAILEGRHGPSRYEMKILTKNHKEKWIDLTVTRIHFNNDPAIMGQAFDITDRKLAEESLRQSEERYRNIIDNIEDGYIESDITGNITFCNDSALRLSGYSREEFVGMNNRDYMSGEMSKQIYQAYNKIYRTGKPLKMVEHELIRKDGAVRQVEVSASLIRDAWDEPIGFRSVVRDVTDRKTMEDEKNKLIKQLYQAQKMEAIGTLAGGIAHDFNNLLMGIQGYASLMLLKTDKNFAHHDKLKAIEAKVQSGAELTRQLLGFSRTGSFEVVTTNINELIHNTASMFGRTKKEIVIHENYDENAWPVEIDLSQIEQVLFNLYVNAWQAMPGGGRLYLETKNADLDEKYKKTFDVDTGRYVKISVTDTGIGMNEKTRERVFEPFFTTKDVGKGGGLGLATSYGIIKGHKGIMNVYSEKGHGATFNIYLPASQKASNHDKKLQTKPQKGKEILLIVDDEEYILDVTKELLESIGYQVIKARSGEEAVEIYKLQKDQIDLIILDMIMPGINGGDTFDRLKKINPQVKVILASGYSLNGQAIGILDRGCQAFMQKPFGLTDLSLKIREVLSSNKKSPSRA